MRDVFVFVRLFRVEASERIDDPARSKKPEDRQLNQSSKAAKLRIWSIRFTKKSVNGDV